MSKINKLKEDLKRRSSLRACTHVRLYFLETYGIVQLNFRLCVYLVVSNESCLLEMNWSSGVCADWRIAWAIIPVQGEEIDYVLPGLRVASGPSATHWSTIPRALGRRVCVFVYVCDHAYGCDFVNVFPLQEVEARVGWVRRCSVVTPVSQLL